MNSSLKKRMLSLLLAIAMVISLVPVTAFAADDEVIPENGDIMLSGETGIEDAIDFGDETATATYKVAHYQQNAEGTYDLKETDTLEGVVGNATAATAKSYDGFVAQAFKQATIAADGSTVIAIYYDVKEAPVPETAAYKVAHYQQNAEGTYDLKETETLEGEVGKATAAIAKPYDGFVAQAFEQATIAADGTTVVAIYYDVKAEAPVPETATYKVEHHLQNAEGTYDLKETEIKDGTIGAETVAVAKTYEGYTAQEFAQASIAAEGNTVVAIYYDMVLEAYTMVEYTVEHYKQKADGNYDTKPADTEVFEGTVGELTEAEPKSYEGFVVKDFKQVTIEEEGTVVRIYYNVKPLNILNGKTFGLDGYYNVISKKNNTLVPGAAYETEIVLNNNSGNRRQVLHIIEVDPSNPDVSIVPGYNQIDKDVTQEANWAHKELTEMAKYYEDNLGYNIVGGMNTDLYYDTYAPRILVYNGKDLSVKGKTSPSSSILYVMKDEKGEIYCEVKAFNRAEFDARLADGTMIHAVGVSFGMVVNNGKLIDQKEVRESSGDAARSMVGVKADGTLVICMNDGRGANDSQGLSGTFEEGEVMLALGCEWAANCDGGGSSTFLTKRVGEEEFTMRSVPCDGAQRPTAHGIFVASNVAPTGVLNNVNIESDYDIFAPKTEYIFTAKAIDTHGYAMEMPADVAWSLSDASFGTIENGKFTSNGTKGTVNVQVTSGGKVVGTKTITVADPAVFKLSADSTVVPYSTTEKVRTIKLPIVAKTGEADVYMDTNAVSVALSNEKAGTLEGFEFTATSDTSVAGVNVSIAYGQTVLTYAIEFGKGSEIIFDFEDGDKEGFMGFEEAKKWSQKNGVNNTLVGAEPLAGQFNEYLSSETFIASTTNGGNVRNGNYALAWRLDNSDASFASWSYNVLFNTNETIVLRDVESGMKATTLGMWLYIPENAFPAAGKGLAFQSQLYSKNADGSYSCKQDHFMFTSAATGKQTNLNSATNADIPESRWVYVTIDISKYDYLCTPVATDEGNSRSPSFIRTYVKPDTADIVTFYIDDITLDYSSAVDDRVLPTISAPTYSTSDTAVSLENGASINGTNIAFSATVADNAALDYSSGKIWVDGVAVSAGIAGNALSSKGDVALGAGEHTVIFEVKDELGNPARLTRSFTVAGDAAVELSGHNDSNAAPKAQSVYYVDINVADLSKVSKLTAQLKLHNANTWETKGATVANGFKATYDYNSVSELMTVTVESDGTAVAAESGAIVSIPVRTWTYDRYNYVTNAYIPVGEMGNKPAVNIECDVVYGTVNGTPFGGSINVATELTTISSPYHTHDAELTVLNKEATKEAAGYENRTYCETCKSVVDWGTILDKVVVTHNYQIVNDQFVCQDDGCGEIYESGTGVFEMNGDLYYSINDVLKKGWQTADEGYCYAGSDYKLYVGEKSVGGITYVFDENGSTKGAWTTNDKGTRYSYGPSFYTRMWVELDGKTYYFGQNAYMYTGIRFVKDNPDTPAYWYDFGENGATDKSKSVADGLYELNGDHYIVVDGQTQNGIHLIDGSYYLGGIGSGFDRYGYIAKNTTMSISSTTSNGVIPSGVYTFGADGKMVINHGVVGDYFYDEHGFMAHAYQLVEMDSSYYFINDGHKVAKNKTIYLTAQILDGTDFKPGYYEFDATGKMVLKNGALDDGFFYLNGVKQLAYQLIEFNGDYYFINDFHKYAVNKKIYLTAQVLEGTEFKAGYYEFDASGKMVLKNGAMDDGHFYINGVKQLAYQLIEFEGNYYFINDAHKYAVSKKIYLTAQFLEDTDFQPGYFEFDSDGKMVLKNGAMDDGHFYINGVKQLAYQLIEFEGAYYFINDGHKYAANKKVYLTAAYLEGTDFKPGYFEFGADGKMILKNGAMSDGFFYLNGVKQLAYQLIEFEGDYYFINDAHKYAANKRIYLTAAFLENTNLQAGYYEFDAEGKMILKNGAMSDGFFYLNGVKQLAYQLIEFEGDYYFINDYHKYAANKKVYLTAQFLDGTGLKPGYYSFAADGKMILN